MICVGGILKSLAVGRATNQQMRNQNSEYRSGVYDHCTLKHYEYQKTDKSHWHTVTGFIH